MSSFGANCRRIVLATTGLTLLGAGVAGNALAATEAPPPPVPTPPGLDAAPTTAPSAAPTELLTTVAPDPARPPVPVVYQPVDSTNGLYGVRRGSVPAVATPDLRGVPVAEQLPSLEVVGLPSSTTTAGPAPSDSALSTLDGGAALADIMAAARHG